MVSEIHFWNNLTRSQKIEKFSIFLADFKEIDNIAQNTHFNNVKLLNGDNADVTFQIGIDGVNALNVNLQNSDATSLGLKGATGPTGATGPQGAQGGIGAQGPKGGIGDSPSGITGAKGGPGDTGAKGGTGSQGGAGSKGSKGGIGDQGPKGGIGDQGGTGPKGVTGDRGPTGPGGAQGPKGAQGASGGVGPQGGRGAQGPTGPAGTSSGGQGQKGQKGQTGAQGPTGPAGSISSGTQYYACVYCPTTVYYYDIYGRSTSITLQYGCHYLCVGGIQYVSGCMGPPSEQGTCYG